MPVAWLADKYHQRGIPTISQGLLGVIGLCMTGFLDAPVPRYIGTFFGYAGAIGLVVTSMSWMANNLRGDGKRAVAVGLMISVSGVGGIYSSLVFRQQVSTPEIQHAGLTDEISPRTLRIMSQVLLPSWPPTFSLLH
jgi:MFS family permease